MGNSVILLEAVVSSAIGRSFLGSRSCHEHKAMWAPNIGSPGLQGSRERERDSSKMDAVMLTKPYTHHLVHLSSHCIGWRQVSPTHTPGDSMTESGNTRRWESWEALRVYASQPNS